MKSALGALGHYETPDWGLSQFPDSALFKAIQDFQRKHGLKVDGVMQPGGPTETSLRARLTPQQTGAALYATARTIQALGRNGDTLLAHITPEEARLLDAITDGATINPTTGLLEFWSTKGGYSGLDRTHTPKESQKSSSFDASADHKENQAAANRAFTREGSGSDNSADTRAPGGQDTLGGGNSLTATSNTKPAPSIRTDQDVAAARRALTVLAPDNDPSFTAGFLESKQNEKERKKAEADAKERERQIWGGQQYWSENDYPLSRAPKKKHPMSYAPGTAENPVRQEDSRTMQNDLAEYAGEKIAKRALMEIIGVLLSRGFPPVMMTKEQADMFGLNNDPI